MSTMPSNHHQPLHNFSLPFLAWGQRITNNHCRRRYRTSPLTDSSDLNNLGKPHRFRNNLNPEIDDENDAVLRDGGARNSSVKLTDADVETPANGELKPWNLRPRRLVTVTDAVDGNGYGAVTAAAEEENEQRRKKKRMLWISLSKDEIEEDIYAFTGSRPSRRPKKRSKITQKQVDNVFPGLYLVGISADSYRV